MGVAGENWKLLTTMESRWRIQDIVGDDLKSLAMKWFATRITTEAPAITNVAGNEWRSLAITYSSLDIGFRKML
jgi:hypothetical protein